MRVLANFISWIFHPLLLTTYLITYLSYYFPALIGIRDPTFLTRFILFVFLITFVFPALNIALMVRFSREALAMPTRRQRIAPFILISLIYCFCSGMFFYRDIFSRDFDRLLLIISALVLIGTMITFFYKISIHSLAMGGFIGILLALNGMTGGVMLIPAAIATFIAGLVMSSRLYLNAHTPKEVMSGSIVGLVTGLGGMILLFR